ncbi:MAG TPA: hypothetical protein VK459_08150, partial [Polyangiaceae bacterium]|nr:hypothetical protein [Polyangiaceae bacterium]
LAREGKMSAEGGNSTAKVTRVKRIQRVAAAATRYDDSLYIVWTESKVNKEQKVEVFQCTIDPHTTSSKGQTYLLEGREYELMPWVHIRGTYGNPYGGNGDAYRVKDKGTKGGGLITLVRTNEKRFVDSRDDLRHRSSVLSRGDSWINMHFGGRGSARVSELVGPWSQGCTVLRHGLRSARYKHFVKAIVHRAKRKPHPYLVVSSHYIRLYHEWVAYCDGDKKKAQDPRSVLKLDVLAQREINGKYIPTVIDVEYAKANPSFVGPALFTIAK